MVAGAVCAGLLGHGECCTEAVQLRAYADRISIRCAGQTVAEHDREIYRAIVQLSGSPKSMRIRTP
ncbi:Mu transposase domain-containing protein [Sphingobium tyrosinilyticum]|uniref:Transposase for insertion sequence element IS21-like C-terminal domain-containing protein n=1 Tax=Sphingobium tyrosinilyticum TaxID=2715436 RepID=A0ABV9F169_9SPHN